MILSYYRYWYEFSLKELKRTSINLCQYSRVQRSNTSVDWRRVTPPPRLNIPSDRYRNINLLQLNPLKVQLPGEMCSFW
jgi:hypothetical protein